MKPPESNLLRIPRKGDTESRLTGVKACPDAVREQLLKRPASGIPMPSIQHLASARSSARDCTYNLFRNRQRPAILCAVPEDRPVPGFLNPGQWRFERALRPSDMSPAGFEERAARIGVRFNGYYLFQLTDSRRELAA